MFKNIFKAFLTGLTVFKSVEHSRGPFCFININSEWFTIDVQFKDIPSKITVEHIPVKNSKNVNKNSI
jgi:hypothetical protein